MFPTTWHPGTNAEIAAQVSVFRVRTEGEMNVRTTGFVWRQTGLELAINPR